MFQTTNQNRLIYSIHDKQILRDTQEYLRDPPPFCYNFPEVTIRLTMDGMVLQDGMTIRQCGLHHLLTHGTYANHAANGSCNPSYAMFC